jgi:hypothetical protein
MANVDAIATEIAVVGSAVPKDDSPKPAAHVMMAQVAALMVIATDAAQAPMARASRGVTKLVRRAMQTVRHATAIAPVSVAAAIAKVPPVRRAVKAKVVDSADTMVRHAAKVRQVHHAKAKPAGVVPTVQPRAMAKARAVTCAEQMVHHRAMVPNAASAPDVAEMAHPNAEAIAPARHASATTIAARHARSVTMTKLKKTRP